MRAWLGRNTIVLYAMLLLVAFGGTYLGMARRATDSSSSASNAASSAKVADSGQSDTRAGAWSGDMDESSSTARAGAVVGEPLSPDIVAEVAKGTANDAISAPRSSTRAAALMRLGDMPRRMNAAQLSEAMQVLETAATADPVMQNQIRAVDSVARIGHQMPDHSSAVLALRRIELASPPPVAARARAAARILEDPTAGFDPTTEGYALSGVAGN